MNSNMFDIKNVSKSYRQGTKRIQVFNNIDLQIQTGEFLAVMGPSGSGKTTLLNLLGGIDTIYTGNIYGAGTNISELNNNALRLWRSKNVSYIFQSYNLISTLSAELNVSLPLIRTNLTRKQRKNRIDIALELVALKEWAKHLPSELSGGQQQRVAIARALVADAPILLCDEPTGNLDQQSTNEILEILRMLTEEKGKTIITVTHDHVVEKFISNSLDLGIKLEK